LRRPGGAHPLGLHHQHAGVRVEPERILLDVVIDQAEIPAFQARLALDRDGDGELSTAETESARATLCETLAESLDLRVHGEPLSLRLSEAGLTFPAGAGGLSTMRSVCAYVADLDPPLGAGGTITFADRSFAERVGWREIVVTGSGVTVAGTGEGILRTTSPSNRLTAYPEDLLTQALADTEVALSAGPSGPILPDLDIPDAYPTVPGETPSLPTAPAANGGSDAAEETADAMGPVSAAVPGGVGAGDLPSIFRTADLTPLVLLAAVLTAAALGAGHALTPGHGKTLMAAYLVGTRGTPFHAAGLGLSVALSHTPGSSSAALVVGAQGILPATSWSTAPLVAAVSIVVIGGWMPSARPGDDGTEGAVRCGCAHASGRCRAAWRWPRPRAPPRRPSSQPPASPGSTITWRSLFVLGIAGGLIPSTSALLILLGSIAAGRPAFGFILVVAFGLGMAGVMTGIGLRWSSPVVGSTASTRRPGSGDDRASPLLASCPSSDLGLYLTIQAISGNNVL
jgi:hypothetical protein